MAYPRGLDIEKAYTSDNPDWRSLRKRFVELLSLRAIREVLINSYTGIYVDEYQDCSLDQHEIVSKLSDLLPVRIVGDPLQAIYARLNIDYCSWSIVSSLFRQVTELNTPYRWRDRNSRLGAWLGTVRAKLKLGEEIDLENPVINRIKPGKNASTDMHGACLRTIHEGESTIGLRELRQQCYHHARYLGGRYQPAETIEFDDLHKFARSLETNRGADRIDTFARLVKACFARLPTQVNNLLVNLSSGKKYTPANSEYRELGEKLRDVRDNEDLACIGVAMDMLARLGGVVLIRRELWRGVVSGIRECTSSGLSLEETTRKARRRLRHFGPRNERLALSTPLLVKGLEFDHAVILDVNDHKDAESLYVALTRASRSLTIVSDSSKVLREKPLYLQ